ncbi:MAG: sulfatase-like hydrolase/transferase [Planctomycetes bacterium]|nr:sulfatase-like hydrolase/transferase [Planctomycetota bacterium]MBL7037093.1 sulfatase-like hydrolase/transferase [Pirellulaceae bacterium]
MKRTLTILTALLPAVTSASSAEKPNIVLIFADDLGYGDVGCYYTAGCSTNQQPYCFIENGLMLNMERATYRKPAGSWRSGMAAPDWVNETVDVRFTERAVSFIKAHHESSSEMPFFLYLPLSSPHSPHVTADFALGKSQAGVRGDMVWLVDWALGQVDAVLKEMGMTENVDN